MTGLMLIALFSATALIVAGAMLSIALNPLLFSLIEPVRQWVLQRSELARRLEAREDPLAELPITTHQRYLARQVVLVGYGGVGRRVAEALYAQRVPFVVVARSRAVVEDLRARGWAAVFGEAVEPATLIQAHIAHARQLVVTGHDAGEALIMLETARALNTDIVAVAQAGSDDEARWLRQAGYQQVFTGDDGLSAMLVQTVEMAPGASGASGSSGSA